MNRGLFLNYAIKEYIQLYNDNNKKLEEFNKKYHLNIQPDTTKIDLRRKEIGNGGLKDLCQIEFKELKELDLHNNNIWEYKSIRKY